MRSVPVSVNYCHWLVISISIVITIGIIITISVIGAIIIVVATIIVTVSSSPLSTCLTCFFFILRKVGLDWQCSHCVFYKRCLLFGTGSHVSNNPSPLAFRDVFVLTDDMELQDDVRDNAGWVTSPASGFVRGLRDEQIPVCVLEYRVRVGDVAGWESRVEDGAGAKTDQVTVAFWESVHGLERRVVVCLNDKGKKGASVFTLYSVSRCTTQLIIVDIWWQRQQPQPHVSAKISPTTKTRQRRKDSFVVSCESFCFYCRTWRQRRHRLGARTLGLGGDDCGDEEDRCMLYLRHRLYCRCHDHRRFHHYCCLRLIIYSHR